MCQIALTGRDRGGDELPAELACRETRWQRIQEAKRALEERAREQAKSKDEPEEKAQPKAKMQYNFTDPESRILPGADGFVQAYNAQIAVEPDFQLIVGQRVTQAANDKQQLQPTLDVVRQQAGQTPQAVMTDSGYCSEANLQYLEKNKIEGFIATDRESYRGRQQPSPRGPLPEGATRVDRMRRKLQTQVGAAIYARRKTIVEPAFGQIKQARGFLVSGPLFIQAQGNILRVLSLLIGAMGNVSRGRCRRHKKHVDSVFAARIGAPGRISFSHRDTRIL